MGGPDGIPGRGHLMRSAKGEGKNAVLCVEERTGAHRELPCPWATASSWQSSSSLDQDRSFPDSPLPMRQQPPQVPLTYQEGKQQQAFPPAT